MNILLWKGRREELEDINLTLYYFVGLLLCQIPGRKPLRRHKYGLGLLSSYLGMRSYVMRFRLRSC